VGVLIDNKAFVCLHESNTNLKKNKQTKKQQQTGSEIA
jgi:hypothetical protein